MEIVLLRVGIDTGCGGIYGPLFRDGSFEFIPIPENHRFADGETRTYGNTSGRYGRKLIVYFPDRHKGKMEARPIHNDPEFDTFTYGDPTSLKARLQHLERGDILAFYAGLKGWGFESEDALYLIGYFVVQKAGQANRFSATELRTLFGRNAHVRNRNRFKADKDDLVLVKGDDEASCLFKKAVKISSEGRDCSGRRLKVIASEMQRIFGDFDGRKSIQRSPPRWVAPAFIEKAAKFLKQQKGT
jgi:hypothetical protein